VLSCRLTVECDRLIAGLKLLTARLLPLPLPPSSDDEDSDRNDATATKAARVSRKDVEALQTEAKSLFKLMFATLDAEGNPPGWDFTEDEKVCVCVCVCILQYRMLQSISASAICCSSCSSASASSQCRQ
jgi:hypothetical protein